MSKRIRFKVGKDGETRTLVEAPSQISEEETLEPFVNRLGEIVSEEPTGFVHTHGEAIEHEHTDLDW